MGTWRCFQRLFPGCSQLVSQKSSGLVANNCGNLPACRRQQLLRAFSNHSNLIKALPSSGSQTPDTRDHGATAAHTVGRKLVSDAGKVRRIKGIASWRQLSIAEQTAHLRRLPVKSQWAFLERLEDSGLRPEIEHWNNVLITLQVRAALTVDQLEALVEKLRTKGYSLDVSVYATLLHACRRRHAVERAFEIHERMIVRGIPPNLETVQVLAEVLGRKYRGQNRMTRTEANLLLERVESFVGKMRSTWNVPMDLETAKLLIKASRVAIEPSPFAGELTARCFAIVEQILARLRDEGLKLDDATCALVLDIYAQSKGDLSRVHASVFEMKAAGDEVGERVYSRLIQWYMQRNQFEKANALLSRVEEEENVTFSGHGLGIVIDLFANQGRYDEAERQFEQAESQGGLDSLVVLAHVRTCYRQGKFEEVLEVVRRHVALFNWNPLGMGHPNPLVSKLLEALAHEPTRKNRDLIQEALKLCPSSVAKLCGNLLPNKCGNLEKLPLHVFKAYHLREPFRAYDTLERLVDCLWLLERRGRCMTLMQWATRNGMFPGAWQPFDEESRGDVLTVDLHGQTLSTGKALVLLALKESVANPESMRNVCVVTGRGDHRLVRGIMLRAVQTMLEEYELPYELLAGEGGVAISRESLQRWVPDKTV